MSVSEGWRRVKDGEGEEVRSEVSWWLGMGSSTALLPL